MKKLTWEKPKIEKLDVKKTAGGIGNQNENAKTAGS